MNPDTIKELLPLIGGTQLIVKFLGPTFEYLGTELRNWNSKRIENLKIIFGKAIEKSDLEIEGNVSPRVLKEVINEGSWNEENITLEYFSGILASSRTGISRDDRAVIMMKLLSQLTTYQVRGHYLTYQIVRKLFLDKKYAFTKNSDRNKMQIFIDWNDFYELMDFTENENPDILIPHIFYGLRKFELIEGFSYGNKKGVEINKQGDRRKGVKVVPSAIGAELFLWVYNKSNLQTFELLNSAYKFKPLEDINIEREFVNVPIE